MFLSLLERFTIWLTVVLNVSSHISKQTDKNDSSSDDKYCVPKGFKYFPMYVICVFKTGVSELHKASEV